MAVSTFLVGEIDTIQDYRIEALCISSLCATCKYCYYTLTFQNPHPPRPTVNQSRQERGQPTALLSPSVFLLSTALPSVEGTGNMKDRFH